ncbi:2-amino-4-hydroxy-6-hydroxymethyldihydropteridine diphosphokinase, partial [Salmonella enterica subsp. enterica serovar Lubbock]|nr:2-amino-4-hydroxy-6-hydroxymethyldihydropteridine diphosphokinase [Salmonella enterica subsp. enterica serovar Lubbock]
MHRIDNLHILVRGGDFRQINAALKAIADIPDSRIVTVSSFYRTPPLGPQDQPDYLNAAVAL